MVTRKYVRVEAGERVEKRDFEHIADEQRQTERTIGENFLVGTDSASSTQASHYVIWGFATTNVGAVITVTRGGALMGARIDGVVEYGYTVAGGDASRSIDLSSYADGAYGVYVKMDLQPDDIENRVFWNADAVTPVEVGRNIHTRRAINWSLVVEIASPGDEWLRISTLTMTTGAITVGPTDVRDFFFEGRADQSFDPDQEWPALAADRNATRAADGVFGLRRFVRATQAQLKAIIGTNWWDAPEQSLSNPTITGWISRPQFYWIGNTQVGVNLGSAWIKGVMRDITSPLVVDITTTGALGRVLVSTGPDVYETETTSTWYFVYLRNNGSSPTAVISSEAPNAARQKPTPEPTGGYTSADYLYVGSVYNNSSGHFDVFSKHGNHYRFQTEFAVFGTTSVSALPANTTLVRLPNDGVNGTAELVEIRLALKTVATGNGNFGGSLELVNPSSAAIQTNLYSGGGDPSAIDEDRNSMVVSAKTDGTYQLRLDWNDDTGNTAGAASHCWIYELGYWEYK